MTPKQSQQALTKAMSALTEKQLAVVDSFNGHCRLLKELDAARVEVDERQAEFVAAHAIPVEE